MNYKIKTIDFTVHKTVDYSLLKPNKFDITTIGLNHHSSFIVENDFCLTAYCEALLLKIKQLDKSDIADFLDYQCKQINTPSVWLDQYESLIDLNNDYFDEVTWKTKINKVFIFFQSCRDSFNRNKKPIKNQLIDWETLIQQQNSIFDVSLIKFDLANLDTFKEKKAYLIEVKANYLQVEKLCPMAANNNFGIFLDIEIDKLDKLYSISPEMFEKSSRSSGVKDDLDDHCEMIRINGNINTLADVFFQMLHEHKQNGKSYIDNSTTEVANMIVKNFIGRDGQNLSVSSIKTMLSPSKIEKRPNSDKRISLQPIF